MSCWVVPAIAAELWGLSIQQVLSGVTDGSIDSRREHGFVFIDVAPGSHTYYRPRRPGEPPPPTFTLIRPDGRVEVPPEPAPAPVAECVEVEPQRDTPPPLAWAEASEAEDDELPPLDDEEDDKPLPPRDAIRAAVARRRRRPVAA